jgi:hypothetical protein
MERKPKRSNFGLSPKKKVLRQRTHLPFGCYIYFVLNKLKILWYKVTIVWIFLLLVVIFTSISAWSIYMVINNIG